jgi:chromosomal replication initiation ATPase DnaA
MADAPKQIPFELPQREAQGRDDFLVTPSNEAAVSLIDAWPHWPAYGAILIGPAGAGKSHLTRVWQAASLAEIVPAATVTKDSVPDLMARSAVCLEDVRPGSVDETGLFHLLNLARQHNGHVLLTSETEPVQWHVKLPDLRSRLAALPVVRILPPDDDLLRGVLVKLFTDRQIAVDEALISYMMLRMPRSLAAARDLVALIDREALVSKAEVTRNFVAKVMVNYDSPGLFTTPP